MKNKIFIALISLFVATPVFAAQQVDELYNNLTNIQNVFFQSAPLVSDTKNKDDDVDEEVYLFKFNKNSKDSQAYVQEYQEKYVNHMPFFKLNRLRFQNELKARQIKSDERILQREKERIKKAREKEKEELKKDPYNIRYVKYEEDFEEDDAIKDSTKKSDKVELIGGVKQQKIENEMVLDCNEVQYDSKTGDIQAIGNPVLMFPAQKVKMTADLITYNNESNIIKAIGNVVVTKDNIPIYGDYMIVNMNEENIFMDNVKSITPTMRIVAKNAESIEGKLYLNKGHFKAKDTGKLVLKSDMIGPDFSNMIISPQDKYEIMKEELANLKISASKVEVTGTKGHDIFRVQDAELYYNKKYLFTMPSFTAYTNKNRNYFEANIPEFGSRSQLGAFVGPGLVIPGPNGSIFKVIPFLNYNEKIGIGGAVKFKSAFNETEFMYGSSQNVFIARGIHHLDENLTLEYGTNSYFDEGINGYRMPKYMLQLAYERPTTIKNFLAEGLDLRFKQRAVAGYAYDSDWNIRSENLKSYDGGTMRLKYMADLTQTLFHYKDAKNLKYLDLNLVLQGSAGIYGTGDTQFIGRIGPNLHTQYKYWMQDISYFISAVSDHTPLQVFDTYRYGHSTLHIREAIRLCKFLTIGWSSCLSLGQDSPNHELFQENAFVVSIGPDDIRLNIAYDVFRQSTYCGLQVAVDTDKTNVEFDKMVIKNPERVGRESKPSDTVAFTKETKIDKKVNKMYAEVIDIEDPDKEQVQ